VDLTLTVAVTFKVQFQLQSSVTFQVPEFHEKIIKLIPL